MKKKQIIERLFSILFPLFVSLIVFCYIGCKQEILLPNIAELDGIETIKVVIEIWGILLGFAITAESILIAVNGGGLTRLMISAGHLKTMLFSFMITNIILFICLIMFVPIILKGTWNFEIYRWFICSLCISFTSLGISLFYFFIMLSTVNVED